MRVVAWALVVLMVAGCAETLEDDMNVDADDSTQEDRDRPGNDVAVAANDTEEADGQGLRSFQGSFDLVVQQVTTPVSRSAVGGANCIGIESSTLTHVANGTITATWEAQTPLQEHLELRVDGEDQTAATTGTSPLVLEVEDMQPHDFFDALMVMVQTESPGIAVQQEVDLEVALDYEGAKTFKIREGVCSFS